MGIAQPELIYLDDPIACHIVRVGGRKLADLIRSFNYRDIVPTGPLDNRDQPSLFLRLIKFPLNLRSLDKTSIRFKRIMSFICMKMGTQVERHIGCEHCREKLTHLLMLCLAVFEFAVAAEWIVGCQDCQGLRLMAQIELFFEICVGVVLGFLVIEDLVWIEQYEIEPGQLQHHNSPTLSPKSIHLKRIPQHIKILIPMLMIPRIDNNRPIPRNLTDHPKKILIVTSFIRLQIVSDVTVDEEAADFGVGFEQVGEGIVEGFVFCAELAEIGPICEADQFELLGVFWEVVGYRLTCVWDLRIRDITSPSKHHIPNLLTLRQINNRTPMHIANIPFEPKPKIITIDLPNTRVPFLHSNERFLTGQLRIESEREFLVR